MTTNPSSRCLPQTALAAILALSGLTFTGCQVHVGGQTLPSPYYLDDDVQYFAEGPEFKLAREAAALKATQQAQEAVSE